jgi:molecular chaperone GrpE
MNEEVQNEEMEMTAETEPAESGAEPVEAEATPVAPEPDPLAEALAERDAAKEQLLRVAAEFDNYRKRTAREAVQLRQTAAANLLRDLLPVLDNLERALEHTADKSDGLAQGVDMILKQLKDLLSGAGAEPIGAVGQPFDPQVHEALAHQPSDAHPPDTVVLEYQRGYRLGDQVLRAAKVVVSSGPAEAAETTS